jgi:hypothetical protein
VDGSTDLGKLPDDPRFICKEEEMDDEDEKERTHKNGNIN